MFVPIVKTCTVKQQVRLLRRRYRPRGRIKIDFQYSASILLTPGIPGTTVTFDVHN